MTRYKTKNVPTNTLREGDLIIAHGGLFRVIKSTIWPKQQEHVSHSGHVQSNYCEFIRDAYPGEPCAVPAHWRDGRKAEPGRPELDNYWCQQGNDLARTCLVVAIVNDRETA